MDCSDEQYPQNGGRDIFSLPLIYCLKTIVFYTVLRYIKNIEVRYIALKFNGEVTEMNQHIKKVYVPMTETAFFILLCLRKPNHGYGIVQMVEKMTEGAIKLTPGTLYGSLSKMEKDNIICFIREEDKRKIYQITDLGLEVLQLELKRIERLYKIAREEM